jgi:hypothetical protein
MKGQLRQWAIAITQMTRCLDCLWDLMYLSLVLVREIASERENAICLLTKHSGLPASLLLLLRLGRFGTCQR